MVTYILIATMLLGIVLIFISMRSFDKEPQNSNNYLEIENTIRAIDSSVHEADSAIIQLNKLSKSIFEEFEEKYQELLFLYSLVDDKRKEVSELYSNPPLVSNQTPEKPTVVHKRPTSKNPHFNEILRLADEGMSVSDISKQLNLGQGEVQLILEMGKDR